MKFVKKINYFSRGFTMVELTLVIGILATLFALSSISFSNLLPRASLQTTIETVTADVHHQQARAFFSDEGSGGSPTAFGVYFDSDEYVLFEGVSYNAAAATNIHIPLEETITTSTTFASASLVFSRGSGEVNNFVDGQNSVTLTNTATGETQVLRFNRYGVVIE